LGGGVIDGTSVVLFASSVSMFASVSVSASTATFPRWYGWVAKDGEMTAAKDISSACLD
jgi:hypothetical protein